MTNNTEHYKKLLERELKLLEADLKTVGRVNPENTKDWEATPPETVNMGAEPEELAEKMEEYEENTAVLKQLEIKYNEVKEALARTYDGTFGHCIVCKKEIEDNRLEANPAAKTCKEHM
jgi:RNA polymerase-binding transcription factor DksA